MSDLDARPAPVLAPTDGDNGYRAVQHKLKTLGEAMDSATTELEMLQRRIRSNADRATELAEQIAQAELDTKFVEMTNLVALALGGAGIETGKLHATAQEVAALAHETRTVHSKLYSGLDEVRSGRRERTPKPGFFAH
ncbi:conjugal transfer protein TraB [Kitasatospora sp. NPDC057223]|uniref:conjugal transfer protein TraB n=1 Tax=Kitasatospora sp. NPDC057223 TaxID=3346055 RepID=UPI00363D6699